MLFRSADGMRLDALKHIRNTFIGEFMHRGVLPFRRVYRVIQYGIHDVSRLDNIAYAAGDKHHSRYGQQGQMGADKQPLPVGRR